MMLEYRWSRSTLKVLQDKIESEITSLTFGITVDFIDIFDKQGITPWKRMLTLIEKNSTQR